MSLILDALNRAERERREERQKPDILAAPVAETDSKRPVWRWVVEAGVLFVAIAALFYSQFYLPQNPPDQAAIAPTTDPLAEMQSPDKAVTQPPEIAVAKEAGQPPLKESAAADSPRYRPPQRQQIASLYQQPIEKPRTANQQADKSAPAVATKPQFPALEASFILQQTPLLTELPQRFQNSVPSIDYSMHVYSAEEGGGFVKLNGDIRKAGAQVGPDIRVIEILEDSVVLVYQGRQFRLLALNSWVNLR